MDHVVYVDSKDNELEKLMDGRKTMIIRGAAGRKLPHGRVHAGDVLYFIRNNGEGLVKARASVRQALHSEKLSEADSVKLISENQAALQLGEAQRKRWSGKRFLVLVEVGPVEAVEPFAIDRSAYGNMDDWLPVGEIAAVRTQPV
jgi:hypothetical protein